MNWDIFAHFWMSQLTRFYVLENTYVHFTDLNFLQKNHCVGYIREVEEEGEGFWATVNPCIWPCFASLIKQ